MLWHHRMLYFADFHDYFAAIYSNLRNVFFKCTISSARNKLLHRLSATYYRNT